MVHIEDTVEIKKKELLMTLLQKTVEREEEKEGEEHEEISIEYTTNRDHDLEIFIAPFFIKPGRHSYFVHTNEGTYFHKLISPVR